MHHRKPVVLNWAALKDRGGSITSPTAIWRPGSSTRVAAGAGGALKVGSGSAPGEEK